MLKRKVVAVVASLSSFLILTSQSLAQSKEAHKWIKKEGDTSKINSPHESWRKEIFSKSIDKIGCETISRGLKFEKIKDPKLTNVIRQIRQSIADPNWRTLLPLFHPRLKVKRSTVENLFSSYEGTYGGDEFDVVPYRVWAINSPKGAAELVECKDDELSIRGFYGYPLQTAVLFQISGRLEIGHAYVALVPKDGKWMIGAWHKIQWTHNGKDPETWINEAMAADKAGNKKAAFVKMDVAYKLLDGGAFIYRQLRKDAEATRKSYMSYEDYQKMFVEMFKDTKIVHAGTSLAADGAGTLLRIEVDHNEAANKLRENCKNLGRKIYKLDWTKPLGGFKCQMVTKYEPKTREGVLGGNFFSAKELR